MTQAEKEAYSRKSTPLCPISDNIHNLSPIEFVVSNWLKSARKPVLECV
jgi:hypothetical protein